VLGWLRRFLTDSAALERRIADEVQAIEERLSQRMMVIEQQLDENEQVLRSLGHQVAMIEGRTSFLKPTDPARES
jgi:CII-binding regulator of phage lambda lysogenization HflD